MSLGYSFSALFAMLLVILTGIRSGTIYVPGLEDYKFIRLTRYIAVYCLLDTLWGIYYNGIFTSQVGFTLVCYGVYLCAGIVTLFWANYMVEYIGASDSVTSLLRVIAAVLLVLQTMILISNEFTHELFFVNSEGTYFHFVGRVELQILQALNYVMVVFYWFAKLISGRFTNKKRIKTGLIYSILPGLFGAGQIFFVDVSMYSYGFALSIFAMFAYEKSARILSHIDRQHRKEGEEQLSIIKALAGDFSTIYSVDMSTGGFVVYNRTGGEDFLNKTDNSHLDYFRIAIEKGRKMIHEDDLENFLMVMDKDVIKKRFEIEQSFSLVLRLIFGNSSVKYIEYRFTYNNVGDKDQIIIGVYDVDKTYRKKLKEDRILKDAKRRQMALEEEAEILEKAAYRDIMTGLYNRRAYEDHMAECKGMPEGEDFVYVSLDVNGLKAVNDDLGHDAGDELIKGAAFCMKKILGEYGLIYRHGGDEFSAIIHVTTDRINEVFNKFDSEVESFKGKLVDEVSVSYGYVTVEETGVIPIEEMAKIADKRMYEAKNQHYAKKGIDRRGQQEAYDAIRKSYIKILKVDLSTDTFASVFMDETEAGTDKGYDSRLSVWLHDFAQKGNVHPDDVDVFFKYLDYERIKIHFHRGNDPIAIHYRRKSESGYNNALIEIIPSDNFSDENQIVFLYVKNIY